LVRKLLAFPKKQTLVIEDKEVKDVIHDPVNERIEFILDEGK